MTMQLLLNREPSTDKATIGRLYVDGIFECYTLEDVIREIKIPHETAIPQGNYEIIVNHSNRFGVDMPLLLNIPGFEGVRIHPGNTDKDTDGCILVGTNCLDNFVGNSRIAFNRLFAKLNNNYAMGRQILITIVNGK